MICNALYERKRHKPGNRTFPDYLVRTPLPPCFLVIAVCPVTAVTIFGRYLVILADIWPIFGRYLVILADIFAKNA